MQRALGRGPLLLALAALLLLPSVHGQAEPVRAASFLVYHPWPDPRAGEPEADPYATRSAPPPPGLVPDGSLRLPATLLDRVERANPAPEGQPESALAHFREMQRLLAARERTGSPLALTLGGALERDALRVEAQAPYAPEGANVGFVVFEHQPPEGAYAARLVAAPAPLPAQASLPLDPLWDQQRLGVVAIVQDARGAALQSATWLVGAPTTTQRTKAVLVEHATATWCEPCGASDDAFALLSSQYGALGAPQGGEGSHLRAPDGYLYGGLALGALVAFLALRRYRA